MRLVLYIWSYLSMRCSSRVRPLKRSWSQPSFSTGSNVIVVPRTKPPPVHSCTIVSLFYIVSYIYYHSRRSIWRRILLNNESSFLINDMLNIFYNIHFGGTLALLFRNRLFNAVVSSIVKCYVVNRGTWDEIFNCLANIIKIQVT